MTANAKQKKGIGKTVIALVCVMLIFVAGFFHKLTSPRILNKEELALNGAVVFDKGRIIPDFALIDHNGEPFTLENLKGKWSLIYFGFTHCPDICPTTFATLSKVYSQLEDDIKDQTQVILLSVDPARDTPEKLKAYVGHFNEDFIGVTGEFLPILKLSGNLNVAFNKVVTGDDYTVDHSGHLVLMNPYGHYHGIFKPPFKLSALKLTYQSIVSSFE